MHDDELEENDIPAKGKGGRITGGTARATGALMGAGAGATVGSVVPVVGTAVGGALGAVGGYKMGRDAHRALYRESVEADVSKAKQLQEEALAVDLDADAFAELSEDLAAVILESITPLAIRMDMIDEEVAAGTISEAEGGQKKGGLMKTAAAVGAGAGAAHLAARSGLLGQGAKEMAGNVEAGAGKFVKAASDKFKSLKDASANSDAATTAVDTAVDTAKEKAGGIMSTIGNIVTGK